MCEAKTAGPTAPGAAPRENQPTVTASGGTCRDRSALKPSFMIESRVTPMAGTSIPAGADAARGSATEGAPAGAAPGARPAGAGPGSPGPAGTGPPPAPGASTTHRPVPAVP